LCSEDKSNCSILAESVKFNFLDRENEIHVDEQNKVVTTPAFMCETKIHEIHDGIGKMIQAVVKMAA